MNKQVVLSSYPKGMPARENFEIRETPIAKIDDNEILTRNLYVSVDPYMRGRMGDTGNLAFGLHELISGRTIGEVIESRSNSYKKGDYVIGMMGWELYSSVAGDEVEKLDPDLAPLTAYLGVIGMTGLTAYFGLLEVGQASEGETVVISAAAGAVGSVAGQIARIKGCRVVGIAGSDEKTKMLKNEMQFDAAINYKKTKDLAADLKNACPDGVDVYFDNVGGEISDAVLSLLNRHARVPVCGQISLYNLEEMPTGPRIQPILLARSARMEGFMVRNFANRFAEAQKQLAGWLNEGKLLSREHIVEGFDHIPDAFIGLFNGENVGKQLVKLRDDDHQ